MTSVTPVPNTDFDALKGYHPAAYVKPSYAVHGMEVIAGFRANNLAAYEKLDADIMEYGQTCTKKDDTIADVREKTKKMLEEVLLETLKARDTCITSDDCIIPEKSAVYFTGSSRNGLGVIKSDMDLVWAVPCFVDGSIVYPSVKTLYFDPHAFLREARTRLAEKFAANGITYIYFVDGARVPILKFMLPVDGVEMHIDLNINNIAGVYNTFLLAHYTKIDSRFPLLARIIRAWGIEAEVIDPQNGYLNSYCMSLMVLHYLQCGVSPPILPNLIALRHDVFDGTLDLQVLENSYDKNLDIKMEKNDIPIGNLLVGFFRYYALFAFNVDGICLRLGCLEKKKTNDEFMIEEIYDGLTVAKNLTERKLRFIKTCFIDSYNLIMMNPNFSDLMDNKKSFMHL